MSSWGEEEWIAYLKRRFLPPKEMIGIGDDCAVIPLSKKQSLLITQDALVEGVHFLKDHISPQDLGYKLLAVNVSDIAAMGGVPSYAFLSLAVPKTSSVKWMKQFCNGMDQACRLWNISLLGGNTTGSERDIFISLTLIGKGSEKQIKYRHGAKPGDLICVTGPLGSAKGGFRSLLEKVPQSKEIKRLIQAHTHPKPHLLEGRFLASHKGVHSMMDLSDGLDADLKKLLKCSKTGASVNVSKILVSLDLIAACKTMGWNLLEYAVTGGEDYVLLLTVDPKASSLFAAYKKVFGRELTCIGVINSMAQKLCYHNDEKHIKISTSSFNHFKSVL